MIPLSSPRIDGPLAVLDRETRHPTCLDLIGRLFRLGLVVYLLPLVLVVVAIGGAFLVGRSFGQVARWTLRRARLWPRVARRRRRQAILARMAQQSRRITHRFRRTHVVH